MKMKEAVNFSRFVDAFREHERQTQFSYEGLRALFDYLEGYEDEIGKEMELDVVALCCKFSEYAGGALDCAKDHGYEEAVNLEPHGSVDLLEVAALEEKQAREWLEERTQVIDVKGGAIIVSEF